jgi:hypothetical protein
MSLPRSRRVPGGSCPCSSALHHRSPPSLQRVNDRTLAPRMPKAESPRASESDVLFPVSNASPLGHQSVPRGCQPPAALVPSSCEPLPFASRGWPDNRADKHDETSTPRPVASNRLAESTSCKSVDDNINKNQRLMSRFQYRKSRKRLVCGFGRCYAGPPSCPCKCRFTGSIARSRQAGGARSNRAGPSPTRLAETLRPCLDLAVRVAITAAWT